MKIAKYKRKKLLNPLLQHKRDPINKEESELLDESHTEYVKAVQKYEDEYKRELDKIDVIEKEENERIQFLYNNEMEFLEKEYQQRLTELVEGLYNEYEEKKKVIEAEVNCMDISSTSNNPSNYYYGYSTKKQLRRRPNEPLDASDKKPRKSSPQNIVHLLSESVIAQDVKLICGNSQSATAASVDDDGRHRKVTIDNTRLVYEGKIFHRAQNVTIETINYGKFPAVIQSMCDKFVQFRSTMAGDTRQVTATKDDLERGRVVLRKRY